MQIGINEDYRVASDSHNVIIEKLQRDKKTGEPCRDKKTGELNWKQHKFFPTMEQACRWLLDQAIRGSDCQTFADAIGKIEQAKTEIIEAVKESCNV